jgi:hypothetical protein
MPTPSEIRSLLPDRMTALAISSTDLAKLIDWPVSTLANFLAGRRTPALEELQRLHLLVCDLERLVEESPVPVDFSNAPVVTRLIEDMKNGFLVLRSANPVKMKQILAESIGGN